MAAIRTTDLTKRYRGDLLGRGREVTAIDGLDLAVEEGEVFGFLGPNGAGKSTTIDVLLDLVRPTEGTAAVLGHDAQADSELIRERVGVLPEDLGLYDRLTGRRHLEFAIDWKDAADDPDELLARVGLDPADGDRPVGDYSKGMAQRLALGMALVGDPELLILDEPSSGLDPHGIRQMRELVREEASEGKTVFFSSHILGQVEAVCDRVGILHGGNLVAVDTVDGLREAVGAGAQLKLRLADDPAVDVGNVQGVTGATHEDGLLLVDCEDPRAKATVVTKLTNAGTEILDIDSEGASLEDVFTAYTTDEIDVGEHEPAGKEPADTDVSNSETADSGRNDPEAADSEEVKQ